MSLDGFPQNQNRHLRFLLGCYIRRKRIELEISIPEMVSVLNISAQTYKAIEAGRVKISEPLFKDVHSALGFKSDDLIEIRKIADVRYVNDVSKALVSNYPA